MLKPRILGLRGRMHEQCGVSLVLFSVVLPLILLLGVMTIDIGNWFVHKRHLQTQVDAAVFAGGSQFVGCFVDPTDNTNSKIRTEALKYAGDTLRVGGGPQLFNEQVQEPNDVRVVLNSGRYWAESDGMDPADGYGLDDTINESSADPSDPCSVKFLDAKATDDEAPLLWDLIPLAASPKASARLEARKLEGLSGFLPWAVPEVNPRTVAALFVDTADPDTVYRFTELVGPSDPNDTETLNGETAARWRGLAGIDVVDRTEMIVLTSRREDIDYGQPLSVICALPTTACYGRNGTEGVQLILGRPQTETTPVGPVTLTNVELTGLPPPEDFTNPPSAPSCTTTDPHSGPYFLFNANCQVRIRAQIDFPTEDNFREVRVNSNDANCASGGTLTALRDGWWESEWLPTIAAGSGRNGFGLCWRTRNGERAPSGNFGGQLIQMAYAAHPSVTSGSGPIVYAAVRTVGSGCTAYANALDMTRQDICVDIGLQPPLRRVDPADPPQFLRIAGGALNQTLDCDANRAPEVEIHEGCFTPYQVNMRDLACGPDPPYNRSNLPPPLPPPDPDPWPDCIDRDASPDRMASLAEGLKARFEDPGPTGGDCPANLWDQYWSTGEVPPADDPRVVTLPVADYGAFDDDEGAQVLPITKFVGFYVTGWFTDGVTQGCPGENDPPPTPPRCNGGRCNSGDAAVRGAVWGYFIPQAHPFPGGRPSPELCDFGDELGTCTQVLVE